MIILDGLTILQARQMQAQHTGLAPRHGRR